jgi:hypothetical protein
MIISQSLSHSNDRIKMQIFGQDLLLGVYAAPPKGNKSYIKVYRSSSLFAYLFFNPELQTPTQKTIVFL